MNAKIQIVENYKEFLASNQGDEIDLRDFYFKSGSDGFVKVIDVYGTEQRIIDAARISYGKGTVRKSEDTILLRYLMRHRHTSPFEMCEVIFLIRAPMDVMRQWIRHRTANVNEYSTRYSEAINDIATTAPVGWRKQAEDNKQGSGDFLDPELGLYLSTKEAEFHTIARSLYEERLANGVAREQARKDLPLSNYTELYWKMDLHNFMHFLKLRVDKHAQLEIRGFANIMLALFECYFPRVHKAFENYVLNAITFSQQELVFLRKIIDNILQSYVLPELDLNSVLSMNVTILEHAYPAHPMFTKREFAEFRKKLVQMLETKDVF